MQQKDLKLVRNEKFYNKTCNFYRENNSDEIYLTREQIGEALGYADPWTAIRLIHKRHADRLDALSVRAPIEKCVGNPFITCGEGRVGYKLNPAPIDGECGNRVDGIVREDAKTAKSSLSSIIEQAKEKNCGEFRVGGAA